ncbi:hypothetical protein CsSME_00036512 [Camellia sinensis var. sinensis]
MMDLEFLLCGSDLLIVRSNPTNLGCADCLSSDCRNKPPRYMFYRMRGDVGVDCLVLAHKKVQNVLYLHLVFQSPIHWQILQRKCLLF